MVKSQFSEKILIPSRHKKITAIRSLNIHLELH